MMGIDLRKCGTVAQTAKRWKRSERSVYKWISEGRIPFVKFGLQIAIALDEEPPEPLKSGPKGPWAHKRKALKKAKKRKRKSR